MTREEIEQIIRENIRTNGRGEITAKVMAGVLQSFVLYTDTQTAAFAALCEALADAFSALVEEMEGKFESKAEALEAAMEAFCTDLLENHFIPWAEGLAGSLSDKMDLTKEAADAAKAAALEAKAASLDAKTAADGAYEKSVLAKAAADGAKDSADNAKDSAVEASAKATQAKNAADSAKTAIDDAAEGVEQALRVIRLGNTDEIAYEEPTVIFYDYDGTIIEAYPAADFLVRTEMPENPTHDGLTALGWNWSLADAQAYVQKYGYLCIGQMYKPTDGKLHLIVTLSANLTFGFGGIAGDIDWGDGSPVESGIGGSHTYASAGTYDIKISGVTALPANAFSQNASFGLRSVFIPDTVGNIGVEAFSGCRALENVVIPKGVTRINANAFYSCYALKGIVIPDTVTMIVGSAFQYCYGLGALSLPNGITTIGSNVFQNCYSLRIVTVPEGVTSIEQSLFSTCHSLQVAMLPDGASLNGSAFYNDYALKVVHVPGGVRNVNNAVFYGCRSLTRVSLPDTVTSIGATVFTDAYAVQVICNAVTPPSLGINAFSKQNPVRIFVPDAAVEDYKAATNWSEYASIIFPISNIF